MKNQIALMTTIIIFILLFSSEAFSQTISEDLKLTLEPLPVEENDSGLLNKPKVRILIKNMTKHVVRFENLTFFLQAVGKTVVMRNSKPLLQLSDVPDRQCTERRCFYSFAPLNVNQLKGLESIKIEVDLGSIHWYNGSVLVTYFQPSETKNLFDEVGTGRFQISTAVDIKLDNRKEKYKSIGVASNMIGITL